MESLILKGYASKKSIIVSDAVVTIQKEKSLLASKREKTIPIIQITGVEVKKPGPLVNGFIQIQTAGQISGNSGFKVSGGAYNAVTDENAVVFTGKENYEIALKIKDYILSYSPQTQNALSGADELVKFKKLLDDNVISQEEFDIKKKQLLNL